MAEEKKERLSRQEKKEQQLEAIRKLIEEKEKHNLLLI